MDQIAECLPKRTRTPNQFQTICNWRFGQALIVFHGSTLTTDLHGSTQQSVQLFPSQQK